MTNPFAAWMRPWMLKTLALVLGLGFFLGGLVWLGKGALEHIRDQERYAFDFKDIDCQPPPGQKRRDFLDEVQYVAGMPEQLRLLEEDLAERLSKAFARHPSVEKVEQVAIEAPRRVQVQITYRVAVLAIPVGWKSETKAYNLQMRSGLGRNALGPGRVVDRQGVLLPITAPVPRELPILYGKVAPPAGSAGAPWGGAAVVAAARTAHFLQPYLARLRLEDFEVTKDGLVLSDGRMRVLWGQPPGKELSSEASAAIKLKRLLRYREHGPKDISEIDVRPKDQPRLRTKPAKQRP